MCFLVFLTKNFKKELFKNKKIIFLEKQIKNMQFFCILTKKSVKLLISL